MRTQSNGWSNAILATACFVLLGTTRQEPETPSEYDLAEVDEAYVDATGTKTRCGKYFILETKTYGELEVKQLHVSYAIATGIAMSSMYYPDVEVVLDDTKSIPRLLLKRENPELEKDRIMLSEAQYEEAKECVPPPGGDTAT